MFLGLDFFKLKFYYNVLVSNQFYTDLSLNARFFAIAETHHHLITDNSGPNLVRIGYRGPGRVGRIGSLLLPPLSIKYADGSRRYRAGWPIFGHDCLNMARIIPATLSWSDLKRHTFD